MKKLSLIAFTWIASCHSSKNSDVLPTDVPTQGVGSELPVLTSCYQGDEWTCAVEAAIVAKTNSKRGSNPLAQSFETSFVARDWSAAQLASNRLSHDGFPQERSETLRVNFPDLDFFFAAENVAMTQTNATTADAVAEEIVEMWWNSSGHKRNMLGPYQYLGAGVARSGRIVYATQLFH